MKNIRKRINEWVDETKQEHGSAKTSRNQIADTFKKIKFQPNTRNLDIGGGKFDKATEFMRGQGVENLVFDPFNRDAEWNRNVAMAIQNGGADTVTVNNVLNVIKEDDILENIILQAAHALKPNGVAYFLTYERNGSGIGEPTRDGWQRNQLTKEYVPIIQKYFQNVELKSKVIRASQPLENAQDSNWYLNGNIDDDSDNNLLHIRFKENKMYKRILVKLTESDLRNMIKNVTYRILREGVFDYSDEDNNKSELEVGDIKDLTND